MVELPARLPIYRVDTGKIFDEEKIETVAREVGLHGGTRDGLPDGGVRIRAGSRSLEVSARGEYWFSDDSQLWNPDAAVGPLPSPSTTADKGQALVSRTGLLPRSTGGARVSAPIVANAGTIVARAHRSEKLFYRYECQQRDAYVGFGPRLDISTEGPPVLVDVIGPGTKTGVVYGPDESVIGLDASWRAVQERVAELPLLPFSPFDLTLTAKNRSLLIDDTQPRLVYRRVELRDRTEVLAPFWLVRTFFEHDGQRHRTTDRAVLAVAIDAAELPELPFPYRERTEYSEPPPATLRPSIGASWVRDGNSFAEHEVASLLTAAICRGWTVRFAWRDRDAWQSDWAVRAADWADAVDLAFYAGHAYRNGWSLVDAASGAETFLSTQAVGAEDPEKRVWNQRLKWLLIAACGPLQDGCVVPGDGNAFSWVDAFNGLRLIAGFASTTAGFTGEAGRAFELAMNDVPIARAWLRAARQVQPYADAYETGAAASTRWIAVLGAAGRSGSSFDDRLTSVDPPPLDDPTDFIAMWAPA